MHKYSLQTEPVTLVVKIFEKNIKKKKQAAHEIMMMTKTKTYKTTKKKSK